MRQDIPQGLRTVYVINFIFTLIFGLAGTFAAGLVGSIANHPVRDIDVNYGLGAVTLGLALGSWFAYRAKRWDQISILTFIGAFANVLGGVGSLLLYFVPGAFGITQLPPVSLVVAVLYTLLGLGFLYFYLQINGARTPQLEA
ncbi:MAG TPA: hypothetical protein VFD70_29995 [Anaerolineae bacterium]|nr:hypothetical protein [Anaerolineae bacterium]